MSWPMMGNALAMALVLAISHACLRRGAGLGQSMLEYPRLAYTLAAMAIYVAVFFYYGILLQKYALSRLYPVYTALSIVCVYSFGIAMFGESLSLRGIVGTMLIVVGVLIVASEHAS